MYRIYSEEIVDELNKIENILLFNKYKNALTRFIGDVKMAYKEYLVGTSLKYSHSLCVSKTGIDYYICDDKDEFFNNHSITLSKAFVIDEENQDLSLDDWDMFLYKLGKSYDFENNEKIESVIIDYNMDGDIEDFSVSLNKNGIHWNYKPTINEPEDKEKLKYILGDFYDLFE